jgi:hypothetical protein
VRRVREEVRSLIFASVRSQHFQDLLYEAVGEWQARGSLVEFPIF